MVSVLYNNYKGKHMQKLVIITGYKDIPVEYESKDKLLEDIEVALKVAVDCNNKVRDISRMVEAKFQDQPFDMFAYLEEHHPEWFGYQDRLTTFGEFKSIKLDKCYESCFISVDIDGTFMYDLPEIMELEDWFEYRKNKC